TKNLGAFGDGGALVTKDEAIANRVRMLKNHGQSGKYYSQEIGINSRLDALQAAILLVKLSFLDPWNDRRRLLADRYYQFLNQLPGVIPPVELPGGRCVWHQYTIQISDRPRDEVKEALQKRGIASMIYYPVSLHLQPVYQSLGYQKGQLPVVEGVCDRVLSLPIFPELSELEQERVVYALKDSLSKQF
ncbi:MAG: Cys/Met metabolism pyridoxal-phosphate-dependent enzyme, partial [Okeania sp. SIO2H7]|nr:Cys/Met metabolism pyridoxal-phosphate-dependent enzyme [Okeania sp. SIO2H7]